MLMACWKDDSIFLQAYTSACVRTDRRVAGLQLHHMGKSLMRSKEDLFDATGPAGDR